MKRYQLLEIKYFHGILLFIVILSQKGGQGYDEAHKKVISDERENDWLLPLRQGKDIKRWMLLSTSRIVRL